MRRSRSEQSLDARRALDEELASLRAEVDEAQAAAERAKRLRAAAAALVGELDEAMIRAVAAEHAAALAGDEAAIEALDELVERALRSAADVAQQGDIMRTLERSLLPEALLPVPGLTLASRYIPGAVGADVGGDFYDAVRYRDTMTLIVGDVQGKGVEAATLTSLARHTLRTAALVGRGPSLLLQRLNRALLYGQEEQLHAGRDPVLRFVTAAVAQVKPSDRGGFDVIVARAGQPPPLIVRTPGTVEALEPRGVLLGVESAPAFAEEPAHLDIGDTLVMYTDGVIEQRGDAAQPFSEHHLGMLIRNRRSVVNAEAIAQLIEDTVDLMAKTRVRDDVAVLVACATG